MTKTEGKTASAAVKDILLSNPDGLHEVIRAVMQEVLEAEMDEALGASKGERTPERLGYRSGYYGRTLVTRVGKLELRVPQDRAGRFSTELFERYQRSERALVATLAEMYVQGVSTRKVKAITEELCGHAFSASSISAINKRLDESLKAFAERPLQEPFAYLILDARYEKVREAGIVMSQAVLIAVGIDWDGRRQILAVEMANRESRSAWKDFLVGPEGARPQGRRAGRVRRPCRPGRRDRRGGPRSRMAALLRALPQERARSPAAQARRRLPAGAALALRPARSRRGQGRSRRMACQMVGPLSAADDVGGGNHRAHADLLPPAAPAPQAPEVHQHARAAQRGNPPAHLRRAHLSQTPRAACAWSGRWPSRPTKTGWRPTATSTWTTCASTRRLALRQAA